MDQDPSSGQESRESPQSEVRAVERIYSAPCTDGLHHPQLAAPSIPPSKKFSFERSAAGGFSLLDNCERGTRGLNYEARTAFETVVSFTVLLTGNEDA